VRLDGGPVPWARSSILLPMRSLAAVLAVLTLAACGSPEPVGPPEGWTDGGDRWWAPGADTSAAFRDLSSFEAMGVTPSSDPFVAWVQDQLLPIYRTNPEVMDSVFTAEFAPGLARPAGDDAAANALANDIKRDVYQRFNGARKMTGGDFVVPDSLAGVTGEIEMQVYVSPDRQPVAVRLLSGTGTALDRIAMRDAATSEYSDGWVRPTAGQSAGVNIPTWVHLTQRFGAQ